jgi:predicted ABC-type ATPase
MGKEKKRFIILAGANGTGKTTLASELLKAYSLEFLNADLIALKTGSRISAGKKFIETMNRLIARKVSVAIESTLSGSYLIKTIKKVKKLAYHVSIIYVFVDNPEVALQRIKARVEAGGHDVPRVDVIRRFYRSKANFWKKYKDIADDWTIFYNGTERLVPVAAGEKAKCDIMDEALFNLYKKGKTK